MSYMNIFKGFKSKELSHEDHLTRAYLILIKCSSNALILFYEGIYNKYKSLEQNKNDLIVTPISEYDLEDIKIYTQEASLMKINIDSDNLLSVYLTDENIKTPLKEVTIRQGKARYDGIVRLSNELAMIIENKPRAKTDKTRDQVNPSKSGLPKDINILKTHVVLEWKQIIRGLNTLIGIESINGAEKLIINDFLDYINEYYPRLNPFDRLSKCKGNKELLDKRILNILLSIAKNSEDVKYNQKEHYSYIETRLNKISRICIVLNGNEAKWDNLCIGLYFGDTQSQAKLLYEKEINNKTLSDLTDSYGWEYRPNFHISYIQTQLVGFMTPKESYDKYLKYWVNKIALINTIKKENLVGYFEELSKESIITYSEIEKDEIKRKIMDTDRDKAYICPGIQLTYKISFNDASNLDKDEKLGTIIKKQIKQGLSLIDLEGNFLK